MEHLFSLIVLLLAVRMASAATWYVDGAVPNPATRARGKPHQLGV